MASTAKQPGSRPRNRCRICRCRERRAEQRRVCAGSEAREAAEAVCKVDSVGLGGHLHLLRSPRLACLAASGGRPTGRTIRSNFGSRRAGLRGLMGRPELMRRPWLHRRARGSSERRAERRWVRGRAGQAPRRRSGRVKRHSGMPRRSSPGGRRSEEDGLIEGRDREGGEGGEGGECSCKPCRYHGACRDRARRRRPTER